MKQRVSVMVSATVMFLALVLPFPAVAQTISVPQTTTTLQVQPPPVNPAVISPNLPPQGTIAITLPRADEVWHTGSYQRVEWVCSGTRSSSVDVGLWKDGKLAVSIGTRVATGRTAYKIPVDFPAGRYELRVTSSDDPRVGALINETIVPATLTITAPRKDAVLATGSTYPIFWQYKGDSGPIKIELLTAGGGAPLLIATNVPLGGAGNGQYNWQVFENLGPADNFLIRITSLASSAVTSTAGPFRVVRPSIKITSPREGDFFWSGIFVPIEWNYIGNNFGTQVRVMATPSGSVSPALDVRNLPMGNNGQGGYRWMPAQLPQTQIYTIRVESVQNRSIFDELREGIKVEGKTAGQTPAAGVAGGGMAAVGAPSSASLQRAVVVFDTQDENKDKDTAVTVTVETRGGKLAAVIYSAAASNNDSTQFRPYTTTSLPLKVYPEILLSECNDLALFVNTKTVGTDTWRFHVRAELFFSDGTKVVKKSAEVVSRGGFYLPPAQPIYGEILGPTQIIR